MSFQTDTNLVPGAPQFDAEQFDRSIRDAISEYRKDNPGAFMSPSELLFEELPTLLRIIVNTRLGSNELDKRACGTHIRTHWALQDSLFDAYANGSFAGLLRNPNMPRQVVKIFENNIAQVYPSGGDTSLKSAFERHYIGETHELLIEALNAERKSSGISAANRPYNYAISVIQSSGMGKSRMVEEAGNIVFTLPINLREDLPGGIKGKLLVFPVSRLSCLLMAIAYPPPDRVFRQYFEDRKSQTDEQQQADYAVLLRVLFERAANLVQEKFYGYTGKDLALKFADYMKEGRSDTAVGTNRQEFLDDVAREAVKRRAGVSRGKTLGSLARPLQASCQRLIDIVHPKRPADTNACFVYFDEAHPLTQFAKTPVPDQNPKHTPYHNLGRVLSQLVDQSIFFVFLSTNSHLEGFAPTLANHPSARDVDGSQLIPPFTELPFDVFEDTTAPLTLANLCTTEAIVKFGRPLWQTQYSIDPNNNIIHFACDKLTGSGVQERKFDSALAALSVRIGITFYATNPAAHATQSRLVETHMRVVYSIPRYGECMHTGSPSEPILAEAAARHLNPVNQHDQIAQLGPTNLAIACQKGLLAWGERRELYGRLLATIAHDIALRNSINRRPISQPLYHYPIPLLDFLRALFHTDYHDLVLGALPICKSSGRDTLQQAFSNSFVFFSHFERAEDSEMLSAFGLSAMLVRGAAIQANGSQASIDAAIPVHMGSLTTPISEETTSAINLQFRNRKKALDCWVDRSILDSDKAKPAISIIFEFGTPEPGVQVHYRSHPVSRTRQTESDWDDHHYEIVAYGHSSTVFGAVAPGTESQAEVILGAPTCLDDFPRKDNKRSLNALLDLRPVLGYAREREKFSGRIKAKEQPSAMEGVAYDAASGLSPPAPEPKVNEKKAKVNKKKTGAKRRKGGASNS